MKTRSIILKVIAVTILTITSFFQLHSIETLTLADIEGKQYEILESIDNGYYIILDGKVYLIKASE